MEYIFIIALQGFGVFFNVMQNVVALGNDYKTWSIRQILVQFFRTDWDTLCISSGILGLHLLIHFMLEWYGVNFLSNLYVIVIYYGVTLFLGWGGQKALYKAFGKTEQVINEKIDKFKL